MKRTEIINDCDKGGLKMIDIQSFNASFKRKWVQSYLKTENKLRQIESFLRLLLGGILKMIDIQSFNASFKRKWVQSYLHTDNKGK